MQEAVLAGYAAHGGRGADVVEVERMFALYALVGPEMWRAIERDAQAQSAFALVPP
jgi:hypothetical protein